MRKLQIIKKPKLIDGLVYSRYLVGHDGEPIGLPSGFLLNMSKVQPSDLYQATLRVSMTFDNGKRMWCSVRYDCKETRDAIVKNAIRTYINMRQTARSSVNRQRLSLEQAKINTQFGVAVPDAIRFSISSSDRRYYFFVNVFNLNTLNFKTEKVYIGTEKTAPANFKKCLERAIALRQQSDDLFDKMTIIK